MVKISVFQSVGIPLGFKQLIITNILKRRFLKFYPESRRKLLIILLYVQWLHIKQNGKFIL